MKTKFKKGDVVMCVDDGNLNYIKNNELYEVSSVVTEKKGPTFLYLFDGTETRWDMPKGWSSHRFIKIGRL